MRSRAFTLQSYALTVVRAGTGAGLLATNEWKTKTVETLPNGTTNTVYSNGIGQTMLSAVSDGTNTWRSFNRYDDAGRVTLSAGPASVTGHRH